MKSCCRHHNSRRYIVQGVMLLILGSALLLCCKLSVSPWLHSALLLSGGGSILLGNGYMLYGLLHHADSRVYASDRASDGAGDVAGAEAAVSVGNDQDSTFSGDLVPAQDKAQSTARKA